MLVWASVHLATRRLLKRLHHLEEFLRICGWCRKVCHDGEWLEMEKYFRSKFATKTSHGMCPECLKKKKEELSQLFGLADEAQPLADFIHPTWRQ